MATSARLDLRADADAFEVQLDLEAREGNELRWTRSWHRRIPATWPDPPSTGPHHRRLPRHRV